MSRGLERPSARGFGMFGPHHWPVTSAAWPGGPRARCAIATGRPGSGSGTQNVEWLRPWEATVPPGSELGPIDVPGSGADPQQAGA